MHKILSFIRYKWSRLLRTPRTIGFGVQSPFAYRFLRDVITERWPYYAYEDLKALSIDEKQRRFGQLLLRLSNYLGPRLWYFGSVDLLERYKAYVSAGSHQSEYVAEMPDKAEIALLSAKDALEEMLRHVSDNSVVILLDFRTSSLSCRDFIRLVKEAGGTVCFDLYNEVIIFFNPKLHPHIYKVNY